MYSNVNGYWIRRHTWVSAGMLVTCILDNRDRSTHFFYQPLKYMS